MRLKAIIFGALLCCSATATPLSAHTFAWRPINADADYSIESNGDPLADEDAHIRVWTQREVGEKSGGALGYVDAAAFRNGRVVLSAQLEADFGTRDAAIWLRVDSASERLLFANSATDPVVGGQPPARRELRLDVPAQAQRIVYGVTFKGGGAMRASAIHLRAAPAAAEGSETGQSGAGHVTAREMLDAAITIVQTHALKADVIDWDHVPARLRKSISETDDRTKAHTAVRELLALLGDNHSFVMPAAGAPHGASHRTPATAPVVKQLPDGIGYVQIPAFADLDADAARRFSATVVSDMERIAGSVRHGWIVDLRRNSGGNMWPMLAALEPLLGSGELGSFQDRRGRMTPWKQTGTKSIAPTTPDLRQARVAVLIGARTSSSGEIVAVAFRGRPDTRSFGQTTSGQTSSNRLFLLPDGSRIALTTSRIVDRQGKVIPDHLQPDETMPAEDGSGADPTLAAATAWLSHR